MTVDILICTIDEGIENVYKVLLPCQSNIKYVVSWQHSRFGEFSVPRNLLRNDVKVFELNGKGLSRNRNNCINHATADICLIGDDDIVYNAAEIEKLITYYKTHDDVDLVTCKFSTNGKGKTYPKEACNLKKRPKNFNISSIEISFRRKSVQGFVAFNELMGLGAPRTDAGEDDLFIFECLRSNLNCWFIPISIAFHAGKTTGIEKGGNPKVIFSKGILMRIYHPKTFFLRYLWLARSIRINHHVSFFATLLILLKGGFYAKKNRMLHN